MGCDSAVERVSVGVASLLNVLPRPPDFRGGAPVYVGERQRGQNGGRIDVSVGQEPQKLEPYFGIHLIVFC